MIGIDADFLVAFEVVDHPRHADARAAVAAAFSANEIIAVAPSVISEFIHVATDVKRFPAPLDVTQALALAVNWQIAPQVQNVHTTDAAVTRFLAWMAAHRLGRKRIIDTLLAATYAEAGITQLMTFNRRDFAIFGMFQFIPSQSP